jgi:1,4-dihydroxy-2-naphthoate octaprenyltransferase
MDISSSQMYEVAFGQTVQLKMTYGFAWAFALLPWIILIGLVRERNKVFQRRQQQKAEMAEMMKESSSLALVSTDHDMGGEKRAVPAFQNQ